jgi:hypothetical protein
MQAIGIELLGEVACTATLIEPDVLLTAAHCLALYGLDGGAAEPTLEWHVSFEPDLSAFDASTIASTADVLPVRALSPHSGFALEANPPTGALAQRALPL